ncbi:MAG: hypothetical protein ACJ72N_02380 [Labedaea sp.]
MTTSTFEPLDTRGLIRAGILFLPLGNLLKIAGNLGTFDSIGYGIPQGAEAATVASPGFFVGELVGSVVPTLLTPFWALALFAHLAPRPDAGRRTVTAALVCTLLGAGITLAALGVINYAVPALGHAYRSGNSGAMDIADSFFVWPRGAMLYPAVLAPIGVILFTVAIWRSRALPRAAAVLVAVSGVLISVPAALHTLHLAGGLLGLVAGAWLALALRRQLPSGSADPDAGNRDPVGA